MMGAAAFPNTATQLATLVERMETVVSKLNAIEKRLELSEREGNEFRMDYERRHAPLEASTAEAHRRIERHEEADRPKWQAVDTLKKEFEGINKIITELQHSNRILAWLGGVTGSVVVIWLLTQILEVI